MEVDTLLLCLGYIFHSLREEMMLIFLNDHRIINIATVILVTISGLYAYNGLLGRPSGFLRQLLVAIPLGIIGGILSYFLDVNNTLSNFVKELIQSPAIPISSITIGIFGFVTGLALPLMFPTFFRIEKQEWQGVPIPTVVLIFLFYIMSGTSWGFLGILTLFQLLYPWLHFHLPLLGAIASAFIISTITFFNARAELGLAPPRSTENMTVLWVTRSCSISLVALIPSVSIWVYFILTFHWSALVYFGITTVACIPLFLIQYGADHLSEKSLQVISLILFVAAAALQLYQAMAL